MIPKRKIKLFVPKKILQSTKFSNYAIATYCLLQTFTIPTGITQHFVSAQQLSFYLGDIAGQSRRINNYIKCGLEELIDNEIIIRKNADGKNYIIDCSNLWIDTEKDNFSVIYFDEMMKIFQIKSVNNFMLLRYFIILMGTLSNSIEIYVDKYNSKNSIVGNLSIQFLSELSRISYRSVIEYNKVLEENELLYVCRQNDFIINQENNEISQLTNCYGRIKDKEYIEEFSTNKSKYKQSYRYQKKNVEKVNDNRRLAQMYQQLLKGSGEKYSDVEIQNIYRYILSENQKYEALYEKTKNEKFLSKIRDEDIFDCYQIIDEEN